MEEILGKTTSICPECQKQIDADIVDRDGKVLLKKSCPEHGDFEDVYWGNTDHYKWVMGFRQEESSSVENPKFMRKEGCPQDCGLCNEHKSCTALGIVDVTNRCNMNCPICFANANSAGFIYEPSFKEVCAMLDNLRANKPFPTPAVQFSGGEPTVRDDLPEIVTYAKKLGFVGVMVDTNGIRCASDIEYMKKLKDAGTDTFYLSFDSVPFSEKSDLIDKEFRGRNMSEVRDKFIENCKKIDFRCVVLVVPLKKGVNDSELGRIVDFAVRNSEIIRSINIQPISFCGRASKMEVENGRITTYDFISEIEKQTDGKIKKDSFYPIPVASDFLRFFEGWSKDKKIRISPHPCCGVATYIVPDKEGGYASIGEIFNLNSIVDTIKKSGEKFEDSSFNLVNKSKTFLELLPEILIAGASNQEVRGSLKKFLNSGSFEDLSDFHNKSIMIGCMHFMDPWNFDFKRVKRCVIHYSTPDGRIIPFCSYNTFHRAGVEKKFSKKI